MDWIFKNKHKKTKALLVVLFLVFGVLFSKNIVFAASTPIPDAATQAAASNSAAAAAANGSVFGGGTANNPATTTSTTAGTDYYKTHGALANPNGTMQNAQPTGDNTASSCGTNMLCYFKWMLVGVFDVCGWLFAIAATLFAWVIAPENISGQNGILNKQAIMDVWIMVRDLLNMFFILILLFAAFCTIFQVDKWSLKKVWLSILINALLVNFSYPIARFIIDISNVAFYYFVNNLFTDPTGTGTTVTGSSILSSFAGASQMGKMLLPGNYANYDVAYLIAIIILTFIMGMTLLVIAALFVVRLTVLATLIMFSPVGFVGYIFPSTGKYADKWWSNLFSYSFFAPIMIFIMAIAIRITQAMGRENMQSFITKAQTNVSSNSVDPLWIAQFAFFLIPIIILWMGMGVAKSAGIAGADAVVKNVKKGGKWLANAPLKVSGVSGGAKQIKDYYGKRGINLGPLGRHFGSDQTEATDSWVAQHIGRVPNAYNNNMIKKMGEAAKDLNVEDQGKDALNRLAEKGSQYERFAALEQLAKNGDITEPQLRDVMNKFGANSQVGKRILGKVKEKSPHLALDYITDNNPVIQDEKRQKFVKGFKAENLTKDTLENENFMKMYIGAGKMDKKATDGLTDSERATYETTVTGIANGLGPARAGMMSDSTTKNTHIQHLALKGTVHSSIEDKHDVVQTDARKEVWKKLSKENAAKLDSATIRNYYDEIAENVNSGNLVDIVKSIPDDANKTELLKKIITHPFPAGSKGKQLKKYINNDSYLKSFL